MVARFVADLKLPVSEIRLESYRPDNGTDLEMVTNYFWDIELARALMPSLHAMEVALRNSIYSALSAKYKDHDGNDDGMWFYRPGILESGQLGELSRALGQLAQKKSTPTPGRIVAELTLGFWVTLISSPYQQRLWQPDGFTLLKAVFPHATGLSQADPQAIQRYSTRYSQPRLPLRSDLRPSQSPPRPRRDPRGYRLDQPDVPESD